MAKAFVIPGDGYDKNVSPHTPTENFEGLSVSQASLLTFFGMIDSKLMRTYLLITEKVKQHVEYYFKLKNLYFTYTHLVCRSSFANATQGQSKFSHVIHSDNCNLQKNGKCKKEPPAYTWRDYSAILYLNEDFDGGEFVFATDFSGNNITAEVIPKCGRMVAFSAGKENLHGVKSIEKGSRCAIAVWFTFDESRKEVERDYAMEVIDMMEDRS